jgi:hypothetical protein
MNAITETVRLIRSTTGASRQVARRIARRLHTRDADGLERRDALIKPSTYRAETGTVEVIFFTSKPIRGRNGRLEILPIAGVNFAAMRGAHVLNGHRQGGAEAVIGVVEDAWAEGEQGIALIRLSDRDDVAPIRNDVCNGILTNVSVGFEVDEWENNADGSRTAKKWTAREISFVAVGADPAARTRQHEPSGRAGVNRSIRNLAHRAGVPRDVADDLIDREAPYEEARGVMLEHAFTRGRMPIRTAIQNDYTDPEFQARTIGDALYAKMTGTAPNGAARELIHRSAVDLMAHHLRSSGVHLRNESPAEVFEAAMMTRNLHTTSDFPTILASTVGRRLGELFRAAESGASAIAATGTARDFRPITEARLNSFPSLEPVNEAGEIKWGTLDDEGERLAIASFARAIGISFKALVNDDLAAIDRSIRDTAFAAAMLKAKLIIAALSAIMADGKALFHVDHGNLAAAGAVPSETTLSAGRVAMSKQKPPGSTEPLGLTPAIFLVPSELQTGAEKLVAAINPASSSDVNVFSGKLQVAVEPRLPNATQWFLFAAPGTYPVIRFLTLAGFEAPRLETNQEFTRLGTSYRVHWHVGAGPIDFRGAWKNAGA